MDSDTGTTRLPSDFADMQSSTYDPEYISDISNKMQIPETLSMQSTVGPVGDNPSNVRGMTVPDRILVAGQEGHVGIRSYLLRQFDFESQPAPDLTYVNLMTPPRVLTVQEQHFPTVEDSMEHPHNSHKPQPLNGKTVPYVPSSDTSLLLNAEEDITILQAQMAKLTRRLSVVEQENERRSNREFMIYPVVIGYLILKVISWLFRSR